MVTKPDRFTLSSQLEILYAISNEAGWSDITEMCIST